MRIANHAAMRYNEDTKGRKRWPHFEINEVYHMFELDFEALKEQGLQMMDTAQKTAQELVHKGKNQVELVNQQAKLAKAERQLGALVYSLHKNGEENQPLVDKYLDAIAEVEASIEALKETMKEDPAAAQAEPEAPAAEPEAAPEAEEPEEIIEEEPIRLRGETKICPVCNAEVDGDALFCNHCGAQL